MKNRLLNLLSGVWQGAFAGGLAFASLMLPVDFFIKLNSMLMSLRPLEVVSAYGTALVIYFSMGLVIGAAVGLACSLILVLFGKYTEHRGRLIGLLVIAVVLTRALQRGLFEFLGGLSGSGKALDLNASVSRLLILGFAVWLLWRHSSVLIRVRSFLNFVAVCGVCALGVALLMAALPSGDRPEQSAPAIAQGPRPPIILITIDTLSAEHMSLYGYSRETTPSLSKFAGQAFVFEDHHSNSNYTTSGISSILTGTRPWVHRAFHLGGKPLPNIARDGLLPSVHRANYKTMTVTSNMYAASDMHRSRAWVDRQAAGRVDDTVQKFMKKVPYPEALPFFPTIEASLNALQRFLESKDTTNLHYDPETAFSAARQMLLSSETGKPAFLWVHLFPPHDPYAAPAPFLKTFDSSPKKLTQAGSRAKTKFLARDDPAFPGVLLGRYDEAIRYVDHHVGQFLDWLKQQGRFDDALIVLTSDHGESFQHRYGSHGGPELYEEIVRVPLMIKLPRQEQGRRIKGLTEHADILPTILDLLGQPAPRYSEGHSLKTALDGGTPTPKPVFAMNFEQNGAYMPIQTGTVTMLDGQYKYTRYIGKISYEFMPKLTDTLFDLSTDPRELRNLAAEMPDRAAQMRGAIDAQVAAHSRPVTQ